MDAERHIFLTGGTGFIGRYLLRDFLSQGHRVTALARSRNGLSGGRRLESSLEFAELSCDAMSRLCVVEGQLPGFHPDANARLNMQACDTVVHAAASLSFLKDSTDEPYRTNRDGTRRLAELAQQLGIRRWIQVSTAYVCGDARGTVWEDGSWTSQPRNYYEDSKRAAEEIIPQQRSLDWTIVRPGIVVGDSVTGYASNFQGIYRCFQSIAFLARRIRPDADGKRRLPLRLPVTGTERTNLVPVDWVASAIAEIASRSETAGQRFHLTPHRPVTARMLVDAAHNAFNVQGLELTGKTETENSDRNVFERVFDRENKRQTAYFADDPQFDRSSLDRFLPHLRECDVDREYLSRILRFAESHHWGTPQRRRKSRERRFDCRDFFERHFPQAAARSQLSRIRELTANIGFEIAGANGGTWLCELSHGDVVVVKPISRLPENSTFQYRTDAATLEEIVSNRLATRDAFFERRIEIDGDIEKALLLALLFEDLLEEFPYTRGMQLETAAETVCA